MATGEEGDKMYFLNWGSVQVMLGDQARLGGCPGDVGGGVPPPFFGRKNVISQVVGDISPGSVFGEMALFSTLAYAY